MKSRLAYLYSDSIILDLFIIHYFFFLFIFLTLSSLHLATQILIPNLFAFIKFTHFTYFFSTAFFFSFVMTVLVMSLKSEQIAE